jgi:hypothetical protein
MEVAFKEHVADRTDWRRMLKGEPESVDLAATRDTLLEQCGEALSDVTDEHDSADPEFIADAESLAFHYPVLEYPAKVASPDGNQGPVPDPRHRRNQHSEVRRLRGRRDHIDRLGAYSALASRM